MARKEPKVHFIAPHGWSVCGLNPKYHEFSYTKEKSDVTCMTCNRYLTKGQSK